MKVGTGFDVHRYADPSPGAEIRVGGVAIAHDRRVVAHSDGDVLIHALCDALLGAAGLGDIGRHFPDSDERYRGIDSRVLLRQVVQLLAERGLRLHNMDAVVIAQAPPLSAHIDEMRANLAGDLGVAVDAVNIKATTTEGLGFPGREEGLAAQAVVLVE